MVTVRTALRSYFDSNGIPPDGGDSRRWVKVPVGPIPFYIPNTRGRRIAVPFHDIHHLVTGYPTTVVGELQIGAWETATGCRFFWTAWALNLFGFAIGLFVIPNRTFRAFLRGRHTRNLYREQLQAVLTENVSALRARLGLDREPPCPTFRDWLAFLGWGAVAVAFVVGPPLLAMLVVIRVWF